MTSSTPIFGTLAAEEPQIFQRWSFDRGLCDRLRYVSSRCAVIGMSGGGYPAGLS
jgi:hypothetical protein